MAALVPPGNQAGVPVPQNPQDPVTFDDVARARDYLQQLTWTRTGPHRQAATDQEIGLAEAYRTAAILSCAPGLAAPPWLAAIQASIQQLTNNVAAIQSNVAAIQNNVAAIRNDVNQLLQRSNEQPILLANSHAGNREPLYDPTQPGWVHLAAPNPTTRDELMAFTQHQCVASAAALGLPVLPINTPVHECRRQIAIRIGVTL